MEWRDVPGYPGYQVNARGVLRKTSGYVLCRQGKRYCLSCGGGKARLTPQELIALAWPPKGEESTPAQPVSAAASLAPTLAQWRAKALPDGFVPLAGLSGYYINRAGVCIGPKGRELNLVRPQDPAGPYYRVAGEWHSVQRLLELAFGPGAAVAAGFPAPKPVDAKRQARAAIRRFGTGASRHCHDCGRPTNDYRCPACWARLRGSAADVEESEWNAL